MPLPAAWCFITSVTSSACSVRAQSRCHSAASASQVDTYAYTLGADYKYSKHLTFQASYSLNDSTASVASSTYTSNAFTLSAAFRY